GEEPHDVPLERPARDEGGPQRSLNQGKHRIIGEELRGPPRRDLEQPAPHAGSVGGRKGSVNRPWKGGRSTPAVPSGFGMARALWDRQLVLVTGKGGVGKTTLTAALAESAHAAGRRVLVAEVAPDVFTPSPILAPFGHPNHRSEVPVE